MIVRKQQLEEKFGLKNVIDKVNEEEAKAQVEKEFPKKTPFWMEYNPKKGIIEFKNNNGLKNPKPIKVNENKTWGFGAGGVTAQPDWNQTDEHAVDYIKNKPTVPEPVTVDQTYDGTSSNAQSGKAVKQAVDEAVSSVYKPAGSVAFEELPTLGASVLGNLYNVTDAFTTTADFVEGAGVSYPANTNVGVIKRGSTYYFDAMSGVFSTALSSLTDVLLTTPADGETLKYDSDSGKWVNGEAGGGTVDQTYNSTSANAQSGVAINGAGFLKNTATGSNSWSFAGSSSAYGTGQFVVGTSSYATTGANYSVAVGYSCGVGSSSVAIGRTAYAIGSSAICIGHASSQNVGATGQYSICLGWDANANSDNGIAIGRSTQANAADAIQLGSGTNSTAKTFNVGFYNSGTILNYTMLDGTTGLIPAARLGTLPSADGTYIPVLTITSGVPSISWVAYTP